MLQHFLLYVSPTTPDWCRSRVTTTSLHFDIHYHRNKVQDTNPKTRRRRHNSTYLHNYYLNNHSDREPPSGVQSRKNADFPSCELQSNKTRTISTTITKNSATVTKVFTKTITKSGGGRTVTRTITQPRGTITKTTTRSVGTRTVTRVRTITATRRA